MALTLYLVDKSAYEVAKRAPTAGDALRNLVMHGGSIAMCEVVSLELFYSARNLADYESLKADHEALTWLETTGAALRRALEVQHDLARKGQHRRPLADLMIAATAEEHGATVVHYDKDFDLISAITGQPTLWIAPAGTC